MVSILRCTIVLLAVAFASLPGANPDLRLLIAGTRGRYARRLLSQVEVQQLSRVVYQDAGFSDEAIDVFAKFSALQSDQFVFTDVLGAAIDRMQSIASEVAQSTKPALPMRKFTACKLDGCAVIKNYIRRLQTSVGPAIAASGNEATIAHMRMAVKKLLALESVFKSMEGVQQHWAADMKLLQQHCVAVADTVPTLVDRDPFGVGRQYDSFIEKHSKNKTLLMVFRSLIRTQVKLDLVMLREISIVLKDKRVLAGPDHLSIQSLSLLLSFLVNLSNRVFNRIDAVTHKRLKDQWGQYTSAWKRFVSQKQELTLIQFDAEEWFAQYANMKRSQIARARLSFALSKSL